MAIEKSKSWGPIWSYQLNSTVNSAYSLGKWAKRAELAVQDEHQLIYYWLTPKNVPNWAELSLKDLSYSAISWMKMFIQQLCQISNSTASQNKGPSRHWILL